MRNIYKICFSILLSSPFAVLGQQIGQFDQYNKNLMTYNPASTGIEYFTDVSGNFRRQWTGFDNAPRSFVLGVSSRMMETEYINPNSPYSLYISDNELYKQVGDPEIKRTPKPHAIGGYIIDERNGPIHNTSIMGNYAFHLQFSESNFLAIGLGVGISRTSTEVEDLIVVEENDPTYLNYLNHDESNVYFDANFGLTYYGDNFYVGYSSNQLAQNRIYKQENSEEAKLILHHNLVGGYVFQLSETMELYPTALVRYTNPAPVEVDASLRLRLDKKIWFGAGYRNDNAISAQFGLTIYRKINFGYSYAFSTNEIRTESDGSHEISLGIMINNSSPAPRLIW